MNSLKKTASTIINLNNSSNIKYGQEIMNELKRRNVELPTLSINKFSAFVVSRYWTNHKFLELISMEIPELQIIELGSGFTPHYLNLNLVNKYIEVDFNCDLKKEIIKKINNKTKNLFFVDGNILDKMTWEKVYNLIDVEKPILIFSEGVISQYFTNEQNKKLYSYIKKLLKNKNSFYVLDDSIRNHPEVKKNKIIIDGINAVNKKSKSKVYNLENPNFFTTFEVKANFWLNLLGANFDFIPLNYILSKKDMDFVISKFKLFIFANQIDKNLKAKIIRLSENNSKNRIWNIKK